MDEVYLWDVLAKVRPFLYASGEIPHTMQKGTLSVLEVLQYLRILLLAVLFFGKGTAFAFIPF